MATGNFKSLLGIPKCSETHYKMVTGNFKSPLGISKCSKTHYALAVEAEAEARAAAERAVNSKAAHNASIVKALAQELIKNRQRKIKINY